MAIDERSAARPWTAPGWVWAALAMLAPLLAIPGVFSTSKLFYARDLTSWFWPHHAWFRRTILSGHLPFWNPYLGCGYSTVNEPALQTFFPLTLPLRFLPAAFGFNLIVGLPPAFAALGMYLFLSRRVGRPAACLGAIVFGASGPMLSTANMPNLSWSCACMPWVLASVDALADAWTLRRAAWVAAAFGVTLLAGEPVTAAATACLAVAYAAFGASVAIPGLRHRASIVATTVLGLCYGVLVAAVQLVPTASNTPTSIRSLGALQDMWSLHPLRLFETVAPFVFGKYTGLPHEITQWLFVLNDGKEPLLFSIYLGVPALLLAALAAAHFRTWRGAAFWSIAGVVGLVAAFGSHTPVYRVATEMAPALKMFRYPSKYLIVTVMAASVLAATGWDALVPGARRRLAAPLLIGALLAAMAGTVFIVGLARPEPALSVAARWATTLHLPNPESGARSLLTATTGAAPRLFVVALLGVGSLLLSASSLRIARVGRAALFVVVAADLVIANAPINPSLDAAAFAPFPWVRFTKDHPADRLFVARDFLSQHEASADVAPPVSFPPDRAVAEYQAVYETALGADLSAASVPTILSREITGLRPREYFRLLQDFTNSERGMKYRFLSWAGTRYFLTMSPPPIPATRLAELPGGTLALYESAPQGSRAFVATLAVFEPDSRAQVRRLFDPTFSLSSSVLLEGAHVPLGVQMGGEGEARIGEETATSIAVDAIAPAGGGFLVLLDSFDPGWRAEVDGSPATVLRADGAFRAVRLAPGRHAVRFDYAPRDVAVGALISILSMLVLAGYVLRPRALFSLVRARRHVAFPSPPSTG